MGRYKRQTKQRIFNGKRVFLSTRYPEIPKRISDIYVIATEADRIDILAQKYYNNPSLWWIIAQANSIGKGTLRLEAGRQLRIPIEVNFILREYKRINNVI